MASQREKAELFLKLHHEGEGLLLPNAWDIASARVFEEAGFPAIATTSSGVAFANGYPDGQHISRDEVIGVIGRIAGAIHVPLTADIEAGYGVTPDDITTTMRGVIAAGAVGVNLEDNTGRGKPLYSIEEQSARLSAARAEADLAGIPLVVNARTDTYLFQIGAAETRLDDTLGRAEAYLKAGATSIFVPGVVDPPTIRELVRGIPGPVNIMAGPGAPPAPELFALGVRRVSIGASAMLATMGLIQTIAYELRDQGTYGAIATHPYSFMDATKLFTK